MKNPIFQKNQIFELFYRPDSIHGDDDEDRIPEELLLKYTKTDDDLLPGEFPVETNNEEKEIANAGTNSGTSPANTRPESKPERRAETPDKLPPEDPEETTAKKKIVLNL